MELAMLMELGRLLGCEEKSMGLLDNWRLRCEGRERRRMREMAYRNTVQAADREMDMDVRSGPPSRSAVAESMVLLDDALSQLENGELEELHKTIAAFEHRLQGALAVATPQGAKTPGPGCSDTARRPATCPIDERIGAATQHVTEVRMTVRGAIGLLNALMERLRI